MQFDIHKTARFVLQMDLRDLSVVPQNKYASFAPYQSHILINDLIREFHNVDHDENVAVIHNNYYQQIEPFATPELTVTKNDNATVFSVKLGIVNFIVIALPE